MSSPRRTSSAREHLDQFDSQRTLLEILRVIAIVVWVIYGFFSDPLSDIQIISFLAIVAISFLNTAKLATQTIKNKEGSFYSQYIGLLLLFWIFLFIRIKDMSSFVEVTYFGYVFESTFQFQKQVLGFALVVSSFIFNFINVKYIVKKNKEDLGPYQLYSSYIFRALGLGFYFIVVLTVLTWLPYFPDIIVGDFNYLDIVLSLGIIFMLVYAFTSSNSQNKRISLLGRTAINSSILILVIVYFLSGFIELLSVIHYTGTNIIISQFFSQDIAVFLFVLGVIVLIVSSSEQKPRTFTDTLKDTTDTSFSNIKSKMESKGRERKRTTKKMSISKSFKIGSISSKKYRPVTTSSHEERFVKFVKIIKFSTTNISLERLARQIGFETVEELEDWLIDLNLDYLQIDWKSSSLIFSEDLKAEVVRKFNEKN